MNSWMVDMADTFTRCFIREDRYKLLISGIGVTIKVSIVAVILGILIGFLIALVICLRTNSSERSVRYIQILFEAHLQLHS